MGIEQKVLPRSLHFSICDIYTYFFTALVAASLIAVTGKRAQVLATTH